MTMTDYATDVLRIAQAAHLSLIEAAEARAETLPADELHRLACLELVASAAALRRERTRAAEQAAQEERNRRIDAEQQGPEVQAKRQRMWDECNRQEEERNRRHLDEMAALISQYKAAVIAEWTAELLDSPIALPDGTVTTWGDATVDQHRARADMFAHNAVANAEGAARHRQAIDELTAAGAPTLRMMVGGVAA